MAGGLAQKAQIESLDVSGLCQPLWGGPSVDKRLCLPKSWTSGRKHHFAAGVPEERCRYHSKGETPAGTSQKGHQPR